MLICSSLHCFLSLLRLLSVTHILELNDSAARVYTSRLLLPARLQEKPPDYDVSKFSVKTLLFWSEKDWLAPRPDVDWLLKNLPASAQAFVRHLPTYSHLDFTWAHNANDNIYRDVIRIFKENL